MDTLITEIDDLADIADLTGLPITYCQRIDIGYINLQWCKQLKKQFTQLECAPFCQLHVRTLQESLSRSANSVAQKQKNHRG